MRWLLATAILLALALILRVGLVAYSLYTLLGALVISRWLATRWGQAVSAQRKCSQLSAQVGDTVTVMVTVRNSGSLPVLWMLIEDLLPRYRMIHNPPQLAVTGRSLQMMMLKANATKTMLYQLTCHRRGYYQLGPTILETGDLFGLQREFFTATPPSFLTVYPEVVRLGGYDISSKRPIGDVVVTHRLFEDPTRMAGVREYQAGDPLNRVHWRATARTGALHSKVYEPSTVAGATIVLDFHRDSHESRHEPFRSELAVTAAASIANALNLAGQQVGLVTNGRDAAERIREADELRKQRTAERTRAAARASGAPPPESSRLRPVTVETRRGPDQFSRILEILARLELTDGLSLAACLRESQSRLPRDASIIAIVPTVTAETAIALGNLHRQGFAVTALVNQFEPDDFATAAGLLLAEGVSPRHLRDRESLGEICRNLALATA